MPNTTVVLIRSRRAPAIHSFKKAQDAWEFVDQMLVRECLSTAAVMQGNNQIVINAVGKRLIPRRTAGMA